MTIQLEKFTLFLTDQCNFNCRYCYQTRSDQILEIEDLEKSLDYFYPFFVEEGFTLDFYGGEPLIAFREIQAAVNHIEKINREHSKKITFSFTTNGSLLDEQNLAFLNDKKFKIMVSFDGFAQETNRKKHSFEKTVDILKEIQNYPDIDLSTNSVFTPDTIGHMVPTMAYLSEELGIETNENRLETVGEWKEPDIRELEDQLLKLNEFLTSFYLNHNYIPVESYRPGRESGVFWCSAGKNRMSIAPNKKIWGCYLFHNYFKGREGTKDYRKYCFGDLDHFIGNHQEIYPMIINNLARWRMDFFHTNKNFCMMCKELHECQICPIYAGFSGSILGKIPSWMCQVERIKRKYRKLFLREVGLTD